MLKDHDSQEIELSDDILDQVIGGVVTGGMGALTPEFTGNTTDPGDEMPPAPQEPPKIW